MYGEKRARQIEYKARKQRESLAGVSTTAPLNVQVRLGCLKRLLTEVDVDKLREYLIEC